MRRGAYFLAALGLLIAVSACGGGGGDKTFDVDGIGVSFQYPSEFKPIKNVTFATSAGATPAARGGVAIDRDNAIIVSRYNLSLAITDKNLAGFKRQVDAVIGQVAHKAVSGTRVAHGGLPGYAYEISLTAPAEGVSKMTVLFDQETEYLVNCQWTPSGRETIQAGCRMALDTLKKK
jgi:hypothetical protein